MGQSQGKPSKRIEKSEKKRWKKMAKEEKKKLKKLKKLSRNGKAAFNQSFDQKYGFDEISEGASLENTKSNNDQSVHTVQAEGSSVQTVESNLMTETVEDNELNVQDSGKAEEDQPQFVSANIVEKDRERTSKNIIVRRMNGNVYLVRSECLPRVTGLPLDRNEILQSNGSENSSLSDNVNYNRHEIVQRTYGEDTPPPPSPFSDRHTPAFVTQQSQSDDEISETSAQSSQCRDRKPPEIRQELDNYSDDSDVKTESETQSPHLAADNRNTTNQLQDNHLRKILREVSNKNSGESDKDIELKNDMATPNLEATTGSLMSELRNENKDDIEIKMHFPEIVSEIDHGVVEISEESVLEEFDKILEDNIQSELDSIKEDENNVAKKVDYDVNDVKGEAVDKVMGEMNGNNCGHENELTSVYNDKEEEEVEEEEVVVEHTVEVEEQMIQRNEQIIVMHEKDQDIVNTHAESDIEVTALSESSGSILSIYRSEDIKSQKSKHEPFEVFHSKKEEFENKPSQKHRNDFKPFVDKSETVRCDMNLNSSKKEYKGKQMEITRENNRDIRTQPKDSESAVRKFHLANSVSTELDDNVNNQQTNIRVTSKGVKEYDNEDDCFKEKMNEKETSARKKEKGRHDRSDRHIQTNRPPWYEQTRNSKTNVPAKYSSKYHTNKRGHEKNLKDERNNKLNANTKSSDPVKIEDVEMVERKRKMRREFAKARGYIYHFNAMS